MYATHVIRRDFFRRLRIQGNCDLQQYAVCNQRITLWPTSPAWPPRMAYSDDMAKGKCNKGRGPKITMKIIPASCPLNMSYEERNLRLKRVLSPHLSIYKVQLTSAMSILLRISGAVLTVGIWTFGLTGLLGERDIDDWAKMIEGLEIGQTLFNVLKFLIVLPFVYHFVAGSRHLIWHLNVLLSKPEIYASGYVAIAVILAVAAALAMLTVEREVEEVEEEVEEEQPNWFIRVIRKIKNAIVGDKPKEKKTEIDVSDEKKQKKYAESSKKKQEKILVDLPDDDKKPK
ncbi:uncharacterized protein LOC115624227 [Scaptodrosophila lebanonensis]|uniref:Uncharacterized protein LOC115624227 n=1 Tax=Drosophila lebanonensis TaxID=7225 RepID=A0A6J2TI50_DROLE|nr:uncharacterized protein LOC115624227 [Scaptodrosophila lebanonensis]